MRTHDMNKLVYDLYFRIQAVSGYANRLLLWVQIGYTTGCFAKALHVPMGQKTVLDKSFTKHSDRYQFKTTASDSNCLG